MSRRFVAIWFPRLLTDWFIRRQPALKDTAFVLAAPDHGRMMITAASAAAQQQGITTGMPVADARAVYPTLQVLDDIPGLPVRLLTAIGHWCIRYTPVTAIDPPDGLLLDVSGCAHLWGGEQPYLTEITTRLTSMGYLVRTAMADTVGTAWAFAHFGNGLQVIPPEQQTNALLSLPPAALRLEPVVVEKLQKLGLCQVSSFIYLQRSALRRRFGAALLTRLDQATGFETEILEPLEPVVPFQERLPCLEPILTRTGIEIALERLLDAICDRLLKEGRGLRTAVFKCYRVDGNLQQITIGTTRASHNRQHLLKLFEQKISAIAPELGIELFVLTAPVTETFTPAQEQLWSIGGIAGTDAIAELLDRVEGRIGTGMICRYLPDEHHWPERSVKPAASLDEKPGASWRTDRPRPVRLLRKPEPIEVTAPIPDYPPMLFRYKQQLHTVKKADGPERINSEWWLENGEHRDYYVVEDEAGARYWLFRLGHYSEDKPASWFIHGFFA